MRNSGHSRGQNVASPIGGRLPQRLATQLLFKFIHVILFF